MRGCACRGNSAGFVHLECLAELAMSKEASGDDDAVFKAWMFCGNCKQRFTGALKLELKRRYWRQHRSSEDLDLRYNATRSLATGLGFDGEVDVGNQLLDEASTCVGNNDKEMLLQLNLIRADLRIENDQKLEGLRLLQATLPEAKAYTANPNLYCQTMLETAEVLLQLDRYQEAHEMATELVPFAKANCSLEDPVTMIARKMYAITCVKLGHVEEAKAHFEDVLTTQTQILGHEHPQTQYTLSKMRTCGFTEPSG